MRISNAQRYGRRRTANSVYDAPSGVPAGDCTEFDGCGGISTPRSQVFQTPLPAAAAHRGVALRVDRDRVVMRASEQPQPVKCARELARAFATFIMVVALAPCITPGLVLHSLSLRVCEDRAEVRSEAINRIERERMIPNGDTSLEQRGVIQRSAVLACEIVSSRSVHLFPPTAALT